MDTDYTNQGVAIPIPNVHTQINDLLQQVLTMAVVSQDLRIPQRNAEYLRTERLLQSISSYIVGHNEVGTLPPVQTAHPLQPTKAEHAPPSAPPSSRITHPPRDKTRKRRKTATNDDRLVMRFQNNIREHFPSPAQTCSALNKTLAQFGFTNPVKAVKYTHYCNITLYINETSNGSALIPFEHTIVNVMRGLLPPFLSTELISVDVGQQWHSVVVHAVPLAELLQESNNSEEHVYAFKPSIAADLADEIFKNSRVAPATIARRLNPLLSDKKRGDIFDGRDSAGSFRLDLTDEGEAQTLLREGAFIYGTHCRVSKYKLRPRPHASL
ncbi:hypothetical protein SCHPADRAFT_662135 [Schizopora paradoxa]|uniref:Uncharacterized protein n=1 Tax=Schizopora paradoxa TaxID=27342 RepID=A0A0H2R5Q2_9AGAM|nr:hypothetical protein SCHPADRAFT_662135 [Schizopora paradoxa]